MIEHEFSTYITFDTENLYTQTACDADSLFHPLEEKWQENYSLPFKDCWNLEETEPISIFDINPGTALLVLRYPTPHHKLHVKLVRK